MKTFSTLTSLATSLTTNTSSTNVTLLGQLINDQHRYLIQKYFDNERSVQTSTVGGTSLTLTGSLSIGAVSATLTAAWTYPTNSQPVNFSGGQQRNVLFTSGSTSITWTVALTATATTAISTVGVQYYSIPANISKVKNVTITIGQLQYQPRPVMTRAEWDFINFLPYTSDIPQYYFIYNGQVGIFPIPSTTGNVISINYQIRVPDLSFADYSTGTIGETVGSTTVTGTTTTWNSVGSYPLNTNLSYFNLQLRATPPNGDGIWYPISQFNSDTSLTLAVPIISTPNIVSGGLYVIGQMPLLEEDFQDMLVYGALMIYFSSIVKDKSQFEQYQNLYGQRLELLKAYAGTKQVSVDLEGEPQAVNPNLFLYASS